MIKRSEAVTAAAAEAAAAALCSANDSSWKAPSVAASVEVTPMLNTWFALVPIWICLLLYVPSKSLTLLNSVELDILLSSLLS